jgi:hypothetical protein
MKQIIRLHDLKDLALALSFKRTTQMDVEGAYIKARLLALYN